MRGADVSEDKAFKRRMLMVWAEGLKLRCESDKMANYDHEIYELLFVHV
jgi:hypothetical protein